MKSLFHSVANNASVDFYLISVVTFTTVKK